MSEIKSEVIKSKPNLQTRKYLTNLERKMNEENRIDRENQLIYMTLEEYKEYYSEIKLPADPDMLDNGGIPIWNDNEYRGITVLSFNGYPIEIIDAEYEAGIFLRIKDYDFIVSITLRKYKMKIKDWIEEQRNDVMGDTKCKKNLNVTDFGRGYRKCLDGLEGFINE